MSTHQPSLLCRYRYDPLDRLTSQTRPDTPAHQRFYCKSRLATEIQGASHHSIVQYDDLLLAQQQRQGDGRDILLLSTDLQRSVLHTLMANQPAQHSAYTPYGHHFAENGLTRLLGFNGERPDPVTGYYLLGNGYRAFNPVLMRFNSPDSLSPFGKGGLNSYVYCLGDPINLYDPSGESGIRVAVNILRWRGRAAIMVAGLTKLADEVAETGITEVGWQLSTFSPELTPLEAVNLAKKHDDIVHLATHERAKQGKYLRDRTIAKNQSQLVQALTGKPAAWNERYKLLNYIYEYDPKYLTVYSEDRLRDAAKGIFDPRVKVGDRPSVESARQYLEEQDFVKNPNFTDLWDQAAQIRRGFFTPVK